jgi:hypothetical protein
MLELTLLDGVVASSLLLTLGYFGATYLQSSKGATLTRTTRFHGLLSVCYFVTIHMHFFVFAGSALVFFLH